mgnify:CR=1 FL=1
MTLKNLCKYYISCIALENNTTVRASMKDEQSFIALPWINDRVLKRPEIGRTVYNNVAAIIVPHAGYCYSSGT